MNTTLESMAQAIFKSWFVDFDPVHALIKFNNGNSKYTSKAAIAKALYMDEATLDLFPNNFDENGLPLGWEVKKLGEVINIKYGKNLPTTKLLINGYDVYGGNGKIGFYSNYMYEQPQVLVSCRGAKSGNVLKSSKKSFITNNSLILEYNEEIVFEYLYYFCKYYKFYNFVTGSAQPQITIENISKGNILLPNLDIIKLFSKKINYLLLKQYKNEKENQTLTKIRDTLLPKLISGEVRVSY